MTQRVNLSSADDQTITLELAKLSFKPEADAGSLLAPATFMDVPPTSTKNANGMNFKRSDLESQ